jgi:hypothetical protein
MSYYKYLIRTLCILLDECCELVFRNVRNEQHKIHTIKTPFLGEAALLAQRLQRPTDYDIRQ